MANLKELYDQGHRRFKHIDGTVFTPDTLIPIYYLSYDNWEPVIQPKQPKQPRRTIKLYRHLVDAWGEIYWTQFSDNNKPERFDQMKILKTESITEWWNE